MMLAPLPAASHTNLTALCRLAALSRPTDSASLNLLATRRDEREREREREREGEGERERGRESKIHITCI